MLKKQYLKTKNVCKVTFSLPAAVQGETVYLVGDFNNWDEQATAMKRQKDGSFNATIELDKGREYQFRYLVNGTEWHNDWEADKYVPNPFSGDNSVVITAGGDDSSADGEKKPEDSGDKSAESDSGKKAGDSKATSSAAEGKTPKTPRASKKPTASKTTGKSTRGKSKPETAE